MNIWHIHNFSYASRFTERSVYLVFTNQNHFKTQVIFHSVPFVRSLGHSSLDHICIHSSSGKCQRLRNADEWTDQLSGFSSCSRTVVTQLNLQGMKQFLQNETTLALISQQNNKNTVCSYFFAVSNFYDYACCFSYNNSCMTEEQTFTLCK